MPALSECPPVDRLQQLASGGDAIEFAIPQPTPMLSAAMSWGAVGAEQSWKVCGAVTRWPMP